MGMLKLDVFDKQAKSSLEIVKELDDEVRRIENEHRRLELLKSSVVKNLIFMESTLVERISWARFDSNQIFEKFTDNGFLCKVVRNAVASLRIAFFDDDKPEFQKFVCSNIEKDEQILYFWFSNLESEEKNRKQFFIGIPEYKPFAHLEYQFISRDLGDLKTPLSRYFMLGGSEEENVSVFDMKSALYMKTYLLKNIKTMIDGIVLRDLTPKELIYGKNDTKWLFKQFGPRTSKDIQR